MRVATLTYHRVSNYGAVLQAYALQSFLLSNDCDARIIDYKCPAIEKNYTLRKPLYRLTHPRIFLSQLYHGDLRHNNSAIFKRFAKEYLKVTDREYTPDTVSDCDKDFDCFIVGSDQVWSPVCSGMDKTYFLDFVSDDSKKCAYASSLGNTKIADEYVAIYKECLPKFKNISIREASSYNAIKDIIDNPVNVVMDPIFLLSQSDWKSFATDYKVDLKEYVLLYMIYEDEEVIEYAKRLGQKYGCDVICITDKVFIDLSLVTVKDATPNNWVSLFQNAKAVVTNSFHGCAFSTIFRKELYVAFIKDLPINNRLQDLLDIMAGDIHIDGKIRMIKNYNEILINQEICRSKEYLQRCLRIKE